MPNVKSAEKRMRTSKIREQRNRQRRSQLRTALKRVREAETPETAGTALQTAISLLDRAARRHVIHPNKAARLKSQLTCHVNRQTTAEAETA